MNAIWRNGLDSTLGKIVARPGVRRAFSCGKNMSYISRGAYGNMDTEIKLPLRDYYELQNFDSLTNNNNNFFTKKYGNSNYRHWENLKAYNPILINSIARWIMVDYKLNFYPYYDLNIVTVYTDLNRSIGLIKHLMGYYREVLSDEMFEKINVYLLPLYHGNNPTKHSNSIMKDTPAYITVLDCLSVFSRTGQKYGIDTFQLNPTLGNLRIGNDPIYLLLLNDIIKYLSHDLVKFSNVNSNWQQCFVNIPSDGKEPTQYFSEDLDFECEDSIYSYFKDVNFQKEELYYIPTRLMQLFHYLKHNTPEHKLFAIDKPQICNSNLVSIFKSLCNIDNKGIGSKMMINNDRTITYTNEFSRLQNVYNNINDSLRLCKTEELHEFVDQWSNIEEDGQNLTNIEIQLKLIRHSSLASLHSC